MRPSRILPLSLVGGATFWALVRHQSHAAPATLTPAKKLWAVLSVNEPVFRSDTVGRLNICFAVVNDGKTPVNAERDDSRLLINGRELEDWSFIVRNGPRSMSENLVPGATYSFTYALGDYFKRPGVYRVRWQAQSFTAPEITFRVLPSAKLKTREK